MQQAEQSRRKLTKKFQSMHPIKDATKQILEGEIEDEISIHAPYKGCNRDGLQAAKPFIISIHAPYKGCNIIFSLSLNLAPLFQSMHPIKDATGSIT